MSNAYIESLRGLIPAHWNTSVSQFPDLERHLVSHDLLVPSPPTPTGWNKVGDAIRAMDDGRIKRASSLFVSIPINARDHPVRIVGHKGFGTEGIPIVLDRRYLNNGFNALPDIDVCLEDVDMQLEIKGPNGLKGREFRVVQVKGNDLVNTRLLAHSRTGDTRLTTLLSRSDSDRSVIVVDDVPVISLFRQAYSIDGLRAAQDNLNIVCSSALFHRTEHIVFSDVSPEQAHPVMALAR